MIEVDLQQKIKKAAFMIKSAMSHNDVRLLFFSIQIPPISETALTREMNYVSPKWK